MRAMGITDSGFYRMMIQTGITYGLLADLVIFLLYHLFLRRVMDYYMTHVVQFLHIQAEVSVRVMAGILLLNIVIAVAAVLLPARKLARENIIDEIKKYA